MNYCIFVATVIPESRLLERIEAAIMASLYASKEPMCIIPDKGMALAPRWPEEQPILIRNITSALLHGLPKELYV